MKRIISIVTILCLMVAMVASCSKPVKELSAAELLDLGEKYLLEMDYEQALVQFLKVIEVEPMTSRGYTGAAEAYFGLGQPDKAIEILEQGKVVIGNDKDIQKMLDESGTLEVHPTDSQVTSTVPKISEDTLATVNNIYNLLSVENTEEVWSILRSFELTDTDRNALFTEPFIYIPSGTSDVLSGTGLGLYYKGYFFIYYGEYVDGIRSGHGTWMTWDGLKEYTFIGEWADDSPNGKGIRIENYDDGFRSEASCTLVNGLYDGDFNLTLTNSDGTTGNRHSEFSNGIIVVLGVENGIYHVDVDSNGYLIGGFDEENKHLLDWPRGIIGFAEYPY